MRRGRNREAYHRARLMSAFNEHGVVCRRKGHGRCTEMVTHHSILLLRRLRRLQHHQQGGSAGRRWAAAVRRTASVAVGCCVSCVQTGEAAVTVLTRSRHRSRPAGRRSPGACAQRGTTCRPRPGTCSGSACQRGNRCGRSLVDDGEVCEVRRNKLTGLCHPQSMTHVHDVWIVRGCDRVVKRFEDVVDER